MRSRSRLISGPTRAGALLALAVGLLLVQGCADDTKNQTFAKVGAAPEPAAEPSGAMAPAAALVARSPAEPQAQPGAVPPARATANRKIIYDASVVLVTEDLSKLEARLLQIIAAQGAYVADSDRTGETGATRQGHWKVRVPVEAYDTFVRGVLGLGELVSTNSQSQDVSAEYYDLDARTGAKKVEEARLLKHLSDSTGRLDEILAVERELTRVRSEIEQMQGRLAVLSNLIALATVTVTASEIKGYVPPQAPTLSQKVARTFNGSLGSLQHFGEAVLLAIVAITPWLPLLIPVVVLTWLAIRRANIYLGLTTATPAAGSRPRDG